MLSPLAPPNLSGSVPASYLEVLAEEDDANKRWEIRTSIHRHARVVQTECQGDATCFKNNSNNDWWRNSKSWLELFQVHPNSQQLLIFSKYSYGCLLTEFNHFDTCWLSSQLSWRSLSLKAAVHPPV